MTLSAVRGEMAQQRNQVDRVKISCSICLDLLKDPVTISCGHNYCMIALLVKQWSTMRRSSLG
uniref:Zinc finger RING-type eukaryotic domain-containing protein n=1 Tax=Monopterus albus TaxID=43700 RepID=A0A3Q3Q4W2_MONAL